MRSVVMSLCVSVVALSACVFLVAIRLERERGSGAITRAGWWWGACCVPPLSLVVVVFASPPPPPFLRAGGAGPGAPGGQDRAGAWSPATQSDPDSVADACGGGRHPRELFTKPVPSRGAPCFKAVQKRVTDLFEAEKAAGAGAGRVGVRAAGPPFSVGARQTQDPRPLPKRHTSLFRAHPSPPPFLAAPSSLR